MSRMMEILRSTAIYGELLKQVPEDQREAAIAMLEEQMQPYELLVSALPGNALEALAGSLGRSADGPGTPEAAPERRPPRRF